MSGVGGACRNILLASTAVGCCLPLYSLPARAQVPPTYNAQIQFGLALIGAPTAWAAGYTGNGVTVAVADTGIDTTHPAFAGKIDPRSMNFQLPTADAPYVPTEITDLDTTGGHGTHVAGIIAAAGTSLAPGVAYNANLVVLRVINGIAPDEFPNPSAAALDYFAGLQSVLVYNASYGPNYSTPPNQNLQSWPASGIDPTEAAAVQDALAKGKIIVAATGNDRSNNPVAGLNPSGIALDPFIQPANANAGAYQDGGNDYNFSALQKQPGLVIAVTAVDKNKDVTPYANLCGVTASWCVAAPGGNGPTGAPGSTDPGIYSTLPVSLGSYGYESGTSMAAPMVSGALAVLEQAYPNYNAQDLAHVLFATAENVGGQAADNAIYGYGMIRLDRATAGPTTLAAGSDISVAAQQMTYWSQPLTTDGSFTVSGPGYLNIAGRTTAAGDVTVSSGALAVDGTLTLNTQLTVAQGGLLAGFGTINGTVRVNGTLNAGQLPNYSDLIANNNGTLPAGIPLTGTSPGTLTFQGNVTMGANATTRVNVDGNLQVPGGPGTYDKIIITDAGYTFTANGTLMPILRGIPGGNNDYSPAIGSLFPFLSAQSGAIVTGSYTGLVQPASGLAANTRFDTIYAPTSITLSVTPLTFASFAATQQLNQNLQAVAQAIDVVRPAAGVDPPANQTPLFNALYQQNVAGDVAALGALSGQGQAAMPRAIMDSFLGLSNVIADRQEMILSGAGSVQSALMPSIAFAYAGTGPTADTLAGFPLLAKEPAAAGPYGQWATWGQGYGRWSNVGDRNGLPGYSATAGGFVVGADRTIGSDLLAGAAFGYAHTSTGSSGTTGTTDTYAGALYTTLTPGSFVFFGRLAGGAATTNTARSIVFPDVSTMASGSVNGWGGLAAGEAGYRFNVSGVTLLPYAGLTGQMLNQSAFAENTAFGLGFPSQNFTRLTTAVGTWAGSSFQSGRFTFIPEARLAWTHDLRDDTLSSQAALFEAPFTINLADPGRDAAVIGVQLAALQSENLRVFASYTGEFRTNATSHQLAGGLLVTW
jgi:subtilase-type serine protease